VSGRERWHDPAVRAFGAAVHLPEWSHESLVLYLELGVSPGDFLSAVLSNDLKGAVQRADDESRSLLCHYVAWLYDVAPAGSWGSPERVAAWRTAGGFAGKAIAGVTA
jgi:hypothetical protein